MDKKTIDFINKANLKHQNKFDYKNVVYCNSVTPVEIICPIHGSFKKKPSDHLKGQGCPKCSNENKKKKLSLNLDEFITKANLIHNNKYDYIKSNYINTSTKIIITCPEHGDFEQLPSAHLKGQGCPKCSGKLTCDEFIEKAKNIHNHKYDYSNTHFDKIKDKCIIHCPIHGDFKQTFQKHLSGQGCPMCSGNIKSSTNEFISKSQLIHGNKYSYSNVIYKNNKQTVSIICPIHGEFEQTPNNHLAKHGCPKCVNNISSYQQELCDFIKNELNYQIETCNTSIIKPFELDIFIPEVDVAIEFNGLYWHNEKHVSSDYHINKTNLCKEKGIRLIHIFEDEWLYRQDIVKSRLKAICNKQQNTIYARNCIIKEVSFNDSKEFLNKNHIQGHCVSSHRYGLYYDNELVSLMTFGRKRINLGSIKDENYELLRFCNKLNTSVVGGASKLLKHFIKTNNITSNIISYCDLRWSDGNLYEKLGFNFIHISKPNYFYIIKNKRENRFKFRKDILVKKYNCPIDMTEHEFMLLNKYYRIYDCGAILYELKIKGE